MKDLKKISAIAASVIIAGMIIFSVRIDDSSSSDVPIIGNENPAYSLDAEVVGSADVGEVYLLEYRGSPNYRIMRYDSTSEELDEIFNVPSGGLVYGMTLSPSKDTLAIAYTTDFGVDGNGIYLLDLLDQSSEIVELVEESESTYYLDLEWSQDSNLWATMTNTTEGSNSIARVDVDNGGVTEVITSAIDPVALGNNIAYFPLEADDSRRSVALYSSDSESSETIDVLSKNYDLDNLLYDSFNDQLLVSALNRSGGLTLRLGESAYAHGSHSIPSSWVMLSEDEYGSISDSALDSKLVYDAVVTIDGGLLEVTSEGLYVSNLLGERSLLVKSRALRFVAY